MAKIAAVVRFKRISIIMAQKCGNKPNREITDSFLAEQEIRNRENIQMHSRLWVHLTLPRHLWDRTGYVLVVVVLVVFVGGVVGRSLRCYLVIILLENSLYIREDILSELADVTSITIRIIS
ncbi:hypothetical protein RND71_040024 [Anisodus tanguticus]|uniref:Uncharacterized protein n=1 Tax=Anisodus tanguticus TaxID=243964 RepID=A0AAE1QYG1_9SOLA|nr:hypothetical protein RND71_040024 [Anisodus tanguticus]